MTYAITENKQFGSFEITFNGKPSEAIRDALKAAGYRWHGIKKLWYGYKAPDVIEAMFNGDVTEANPCTVEEPTVNKYGVQVGDVFTASWGYEQTNVDFFQVVSLVGSSSVRVREVRPVTVKSEAVSSMSENNVYNITRDILDPVPSSVFIEDQEHGDIKRLKSYAADGKSNPLFKLASYANAHLLPVGEFKTYESWYY